MPWCPGSTNIFPCANIGRTLFYIYFKFQECRSAGCRTLAEAKIHIEQKRKKEYELNAQKVKESGQVIPNNKSGQKMNRPMKIEVDGSLDPKNGGTGLDSGGRDSPKTTGHTSVKQWDDWDIVGLPGAELLSASVSTFEISVPVSINMLSFFCIYSCSHVLYSIQCRMIHRFFFVSGKASVLSEQIATQSLSENAGGVNAGDTQGQCPQETRCPCLIQS
jgi:hypothetical protein